MYLYSLVILQDMHKPILVKLKQHKPLLSCGRTLLDIMAFQRDSYLIRAEILKSELISEL